MIIKCLFPIKNSQQISIFLRSAGFLLIFDVCSFTDPTDSAKVVVLRSFGAEQMGSVSGIVHPVNGVTAFGIEGRLLLLPSPLTRHSASAASAV